MWPVKTWCWSLKTAFTVLVLLEYRRQLHCHYQYVLLGNKGGSKCIKFRYRKFRRVPFQFAILDWFHSDIYMWHPFSNLKRKVIEFGCMASRSITCTNLWYMVASQVTNIIGASRPDGIPSRRDPLWVCWFFFFSSAGMFCAHML